MLDSSHNGCQNTAITIGFAGGGKRSQLAARAGTGSGRSGRSFCDVPLPECLISTPLDQPVTGAVGVCTCNGSHVALATFLGDDSRAPRCSLLVQRFGKTN